MNWYYLKDGKATGPLSEKALREMASCGIIQDETLVCREGEENWMEFRSLPTKKPKAAPPSSVKEYRQLFKDTAQLCQTLYSRGKQSEVAQSKFSKVKTGAGIVHEQVSSLTEARKSGNFDTEHPESPKERSLGLKRRKPLKRVVAIGLTLLSGLFCIGSIINHFQERKYREEGTWKPSSTHSTSTNTHSRSQMIKCFGCDGSKVWRVGCTKCNGTRTFTTRKGFEMVCPDCQGSGVKPISCPDCNGQGMVPSSRKNLNTPRHQGFDPDYPLGF